MDMDELVDKDTGKAIVIDNKPSAGTRVAGFLSNLGGGLKKGAVVAGRFVKDVDQGMQKNRAMQASKTSMGNRDTIRSLQEQVKIAKLKNKLKQYQLGGQNTNQSYGGTPLEQMWGGRR